MRKPSSRGVFDCTASDMIGSGDTLAARYFQQPIPLLARQLQIRSFGCFPNAFGIGAADDWNDSGRMFQKPRQGNDGATAPPPLCNYVQFGNHGRRPINFLRRQQMPRAAAELTAR